jgi:hypothetical protein
VRGLHAGVGRVEVVGVGFGSEPTISDLRDVCLAVRFRQVSKEASTKQFVKYAERASTQWPDGPIWHPGGARNTVRRKVFRATVPCEKHKHEKVLNNLWNVEGPAYEGSNCWMDEGL